MAVEIERRFLLANDTWRAHIRKSLLMRQGYLTVEKECTIRVRISGNDARLTIKGFISNVSRHEFEYPIPRADAESILANLCPFVLEKTRHFIDVDDVVFDIDEYGGENAPLIIAELELPAEDAPYPRPAWLGEEITADGRYTNAYLSRHPFSQWHNK